MRRILLIDTASSNLIVGLNVCDGKKKRRVVCVKKVLKGAAEVLPGMIESVLKKAKITIGDVSSICVNVGPGSFTGVRVGVVMAKALGEANMIEVRAVNTFDIISYKKVGTAVVHSNKDKFYNSENEFCSLADLGLLPQPLFVFNSPIKVGEKVGLKTYIYNFFTLALDAKKVDVNKLEPYYAKLSQAEESLVKTQKK